ncbi:hypothetical protein [Armatimonas sp.]|uniref:TlpA family protein disulfide reductase n=1 Tax=Armatimonas sp. TaxID=1872638 RepID=UPI00286BE8EE|nr:hypothetical protein [Armatimonas sp.]
MTNFIQRNKLQLSTVLALQKLSDAYGLAGFPRLFLLDPDGKVLNNGSEGSTSIEKLLRTI